MPDFTTAQGRYLSYISAYTELYDVPPIQAEIAEGLDVSAASVNHMLKTLEQKKLIRRAVKTHEIQILIDREKIPKWQGRRIERTVRLWLPEEEPAPSRQSGSRKPKQIFRVKITLIGSKPAIWRRIEIGDATLAELHEYIQTAMGWTNSHLHQFHIDGKRYTDPRLMEDDFEDFGAKAYTGIRISDLISRYGAKLKMVYEYDFGDGWEHAVELEDIADAEPGEHYPRCTAGKRACPPEDVGGIYGYEEFLEAIRDPKHEQHEDFMDWIGEFDPAEFDPKETTAAMWRGLSES